MFGLFNIKTIPTPFPLYKSPIFSIKNSDCCICGKSFFNVQTFIVFIKKDGSLIKTSPGRSDSKPYYICEKCLKKTQRKLKKVSKLNKQYLPLHISNTDPIVRDFAIQKLGRL
jgi:hypothetical protein